MKILLMPFLLSFQILGLSRAYSFFQEKPDEALNINKNNQEVFFNERPVIKTIAGNGDSIYTSKPALAVSVAMNNPQGIAKDADGNIYVAEFLNHIIRKIEKKTGISSVFAGSGIAGFSGDNGPASEARLSGPTGVAIDQHNNLFIADSFNNRIRKVNLQTGIITTLAGCDSRPGFAGDGGNAAHAKLNWPRGITLSPDGILYIADNNNHRIRKVDLNGKISTIAGTGTRGFSGDGGKATDALLYYPSSVALDVEGNIYISDSRNKRIRKIDLNGIITTAFYPDDSYNDIVHIACDRQGYLYMVDELGNSITRCFLRDGSVSTIVDGDKNHPGFSGEGLSPMNAQLSAPGAIFLDQKSGDLLLSDSGNDRVRMISTEYLPLQKVGDAPVTFHAYASSRLPITYTSSNTKVAIFKKNVMHIVGEGETIITAAQAGNSVFRPASKKRYLMVTVPKREDDLANIAKLVNTKYFKLFAYALTGFLILTVTATWFYNKQKNERDTAVRLHSEKERIAQDLHDNIGSQLTSINLSLTKLASEFSMPEQRIETLNQDINAVIGELRNTIWAINKETIAIGELFDRTRTLFWRLSQSTKINFDLISDIQSEDVFLNPISSINIFRIIQEAVVNSVKHSHANQVDVLFRIHDKEIEIVIQDNGCGFTLGESLQSEHYGLQGMLKRAKELNGTIIFNSQHNSGTSVVLRTDLKNILRK